MACRLSGKKSRLIIPLAVIAIISYLVYQSFGYLQLTYFTLQAREDVALERTNPKVQGGGYLLRRFRSKFNPFDTHVVYEKRDGAVYVTMVYDDEKILARAGDADKFFFFPERYSPDLTIEPLYIDKIEPDEPMGIVVNNGSRSYFVHDGDFHTQQTIYDVVEKMNVPYKYPLHPLSGTYYLRDADGKVFLSRYARGCNMDGSSGFELVEGVGSGRLKFLTNSEGRESYYLSDGHYLLYIAPRCSDPLPLYVKIAESDEFVIPQGDTYGLFAVRLHYLPVEDESVDTRQENAGIIDFSETRAFFRGKYIPQLQVKSLQIDFEANPSSGDAYRYGTVFHDNNSIFCENKLVYDAPGQNPAGLELEEMPTTDSDENGKYFEARMATEADAGARKWKPFLRFHCNRSDFHIDWQDDSIQ